MIELGGNIVLSGFRDLEAPELVVVKKIVGTYARKFSDHHGEEAKLHLTLKKVHAREKSEVYEISTRLEHGRGKPNAAKASDRNLFIALDEALKKLAVETGLKA
jgi:hypothetical protein